MALARRLAPLLLAPLAVAGCDLPTSVGDNSRIVAAVPDALWRELEPAVARSLEPQTFTVRNERIFEVAHVDPGQPDWRDFRKLRQVMVVGEAVDPWVAEALEEVEGSVPREPAILQARNVWARPQHVTIVLLPPGSPPRAAVELMPQVGELYLRRIEAYARARMFVSGEQPAVADSLARIAGFSLRIPAVYRVTEPEVGVFVFRNDQPDPSQLIRQLTVARRPTAEIPLTAEEAYAWRADLTARTTTPSQVTDSLQSVRTGLRLGERPVVEVQTTWSNPPGAWPAGGPVITRLVQCPRFTYLVDGWLYAPGRPKYEYMIQIQTLLDSFHCTD